MKNIRPSVLWVGIIMILGSIALIVHLGMRGQSSVQASPELEVVSVSEEKPQTITIVGQPEVPEPVVVTNVVVDPLREERNRILQEMGFGTNGGYKFSVEYRKSSTNENKSVSVSEKTN